MYTITCMSGMYIYCQMGFLSIIVTTIYIYNCIINCPMCIVRVHLSIKLNGFCLCIFGSFHFFPDVANGVQDNMEELTWARVSVSNE